MIGRRRDRTRGQGLAEFALVMPIFLVAFFGLIDVGRLVYMNSTLSQAAREAGRLGAVEASWIAGTDAGCNQPNGPVCPPDVATLRTHMQDAANRMMTPFGAVSNLYMQCRASSAAAPTGAWTTQTCASTTRSAGGSNVIDVRVTGNWTAITPVISQLIGPKTLSGSATYVIN